MEINDSDFDEKTKGRTVLIDFWAEWCGPCLAFKPVFKNAAQKASIPFYTCNVDANPTMGARFLIQAIPSLLILSDGKEVDRVQGGMDEGSLLKYVSKYEGSID